MTERQDEPAGLVLEIQKMSTEDGPGLRTTLFLKGCSLACEWCHNPESISSRPQVRWIENRCVGCLECLEVCPESALSDSGEGIAVDRRRCTGCGACAEHCPSGALEVWGRRMSCSEAFAELIKDRAYFGNKGGVTVSGGEATLQADFVHCLLSRLRNEGIHTALDTCGVCATEKLRHACEHADLILFDLKDIDPAMHERNTHGPLDRVLRNFQEVVDIVRASRLHSQAWPGHHPKSLWVRTPVIPGRTDRRDNITGIARYILDNGEGTVDRWELCAFNNLCRDKYRRLGAPWTLEEVPLMAKDHMEELRASALDEGIPEDVVCWTGMVRQNDE